MEVNLIYRKYFLFVALLIIGLNTVVYSQGILFSNFQNKSYKLFQKNDKPFQLNKQTGFTNFFPLNNNDYLEYIERDTTVFRTAVQDYPGLNYSVLREVIGDTLMSNGMTYKILKWTKCANSVSEPPQFEYLRKDTNGNVYIFFHNTDNLLYGFDRNVGDTYDSQYAGFKWKLLNKYTIAGFGSQHNAIDFVIIDSNAVVKRQETIIEDFGLTYYRGDININSGLPEGSFFGGIINDTTYGELLAKRQEIDWREFYPLHIGDFWKYEGFEGSFQTYTYRTVIKDTLMPDGQIYKVVYSEKHGGPFPGEGFNIERFDSASSVMTWNSFEAKPRRIYKFSACLGDTFSGGSQNSYYRFDDKSYDEIHFFLYPDLVFYGLTFAKGLGLIESTVEGGGSYLTGAVIDGKVYGDTTTTSIDEEYDIPNNFELYQNYPNPFNPSTTIKFTIPKYSKVMLKVYDLLGREIITLIEEEKAPGNYGVIFNAEDLASGVYIYTLKANSFLSSKKLILLK